MFENKNLHTGPFIFTYDPEIDTIISGSDDYLLKFLPFNESIVKDSIEKNNEITSILYSDSKIFFSQKEQLYMSLIDSPSEEIYLSTLTSSIKQILYNKKFNYVISYDEDDNIHIVNLDNKKIFQYKSTNNCSLKFGILSKDDEFLILCGVDGCITIYNLVKENSENSALKFNKKFFAFSKTTLDNKNQTNSIDINSSNDIIISGDLLLKKVNLFNNDNKIESITEFFHKDNINFCKFITNEIILTLDTSNMIKIWDYVSKKLLHQYENKELNNLKPITYLDIVFKDNFTKYYILFNDEMGGINISEELTIDKINKEKDEEYEKLINDMMEEKNENEKKEETNLQRKLSEIKTKKSAPINDANPSEINSLAPTPSPIKQSMSSQNNNVFQFKNNLLNQDNQNTIINKENISHPILSEQKEHIKVDYSMSKCDKNSSPFNIIIDYHDDIYKIYL